jgi:hypothetical protein
VVLVVLVLVVLVLVVLVLVVLVLVVDAAPPPGACGGRPGVRTLRVVVSVPNSMECPLLASLVHPGRRDWLLSSLEIIIELSLQVVP